MTKPRSRLLESLFAEQRVLSVSELTEQVRNMLEVEFSAVQVQGEISNYKRAASGHWYFTLRDESAQLRAVFFRQWNRLMRFEPENGLEVRVRGGLSVYAERGDYQLMVEMLEPVGVGALQLAFEQQVRRLAAEGLFDETRKRPLPVLPRRIGIVTSPVGAVIQDMLRILERRNPHIDVIIVPVRVQGNTAAGEIADAIRLLNKYGKKKGSEVDVIIVGRGGGSMEDLWAFNEEQVARAIFNSEIPVISAVGHETDFTVADLVADLRAPTPSAAAELVAPEAEALRERVEDLHSELSRAMSFYLLQRRMKLHDLTRSRGFAEIVGAVYTLAQRRRELEERAARALQTGLQRARLRLEQAQRRLEAADFRAPIALGTARLESFQQRLERAIHSRLEREWHQLALRVSKLEVLSPLSVLGRGYALVKDESGHLVTRADSLVSGQRIRVRFEDGEIGCQVNES
jgi:exodeoxyribonuclease VII large subunit